MATSSIFFRFHRLTRKSFLRPFPFYSISCHLDPSAVSSSLRQIVPSLRTDYQKPNPFDHRCYSFYQFRRFYSAESNSSTVDGGNVSRGCDLDSAAGSEFMNSMRDGGLETSGHVEDMLPVRVVVSLLDYVHDFTHVPWWIIIASSTLSLRLVIFPVLILQLKKLKRISEIFSQSPPPLLPSPGKSFFNQISLFLKEKRAAGCPSLLWFFAYISVQVPCFFLWMYSIRRMSLTHHPGFDFGGALWFVNLTECPRGMFGPIFPFLIAALHYTNVQFSFKTSLKSMKGTLGFLFKLYRIYLQILTIPMFVIGFCIPQGSLVYWTTNSTLTIFQQLCLQSDFVRQKLGLPIKTDTKVTATKEEDQLQHELSSPPSEDKKMVSAHSLSPNELLSLSVKFLAAGKREKAIPLLHLALDKDPTYVRAMIVMGQSLLQKEALDEAIIYLERAISKLLVDGHPTDMEEVDLLIVASQWAGVVRVRQGKSEEGIEHLLRVGAMEEPNEASIKAHYFDALLLLSSALYAAGRRAEALKYIRLVVSYNPSYKEYLKECENDMEGEDNNLTEGEDNNLVNDLVNSRRRNY